MLARKRIKELTERLNRADGIAAERGDIIATLDRRLQDLDRVRLALNKSLRDAHAENARLRVQREELADHLKHALADRNAAEGALDVVITGGPADKESK
jgi:predicted  nucleic acid-binding Zn-ribbon protein